MTYGVDENRVRGEMRRSEHDCCLSTPPNFGCKVMRDEQALKSPVCGGVSIQGRLNDRLDDAIEDIMEMTKQLDWDEVELAEAKGRALGVAQCIAFIQNPFVVNVDEIRDEAMGRYYDRHPDEADED